MELWEAIQAKDKKGIRALLDSGANVNAKDGDGMTALLLLARDMRDVAIAERVIAAGAELDAIDDGEYEGHAALHHAVKARKLDFAELLVKKGAKIDVRDRENGATPLHHLCKSESGVMSATEIAGAKWLLEKGADPMALDDDKATPLHLAAGSGCLAIVDELVKRGATVTRDAYGNTPLFYCLSTHDKDTKLWDRLIALGCGIDDQNDSKTTPLMEAQCSWNPAGVKYFIAKGANLGLVDDEGKTALERARALKQTKIVPLLEKATRSK